MVEVREKNYFAWVFSIREAAVIMGMLGGGYWLEGVILGEKNTMYKYF